MKRFDYALRPKRPGVEIPALAITVFNPDSEKFSEIATKPIALAVSAGSRVSAGDLVGSLTARATSEIKSRSQGIFQNVTDPREVRDQRVSVLALAATAAGLWCSVACLFAVVRAHRRKSGDVPWQRKRHAKGTAQRKLAEAQKLLADGQATDALRAVRSALVGLVADMRNVIAEGMTASDIDAILIQTRIPDAEKTALLQLLELIESAEYGSGITSDTRSIIERTEGLIPSLARHLERGA